MSQDLRERLQQMELRSAAAARVEEQLRTSLDVAATELLRTKRELEQVISKSAHPGVVEAFKPKQFCGMEVLTVDQWELRHLIDCARATGQSFASSRAAWFYINLLEGAAELLWRGCARAFFHEQESYFYRDEFFCGLQGGTPVGEPRACGERDFEANATADFRRHGARHKLPTSTTPPSCGGRAQVRERLQTKISTKKCVYTDVKTFDAYVTAAERIVANDLCV